MCQTTAAAESVDNMCLYFLSYSWIIKFSLKDATSKCIRKLISDNMYINQSVLDGNVSINNK